MNLLVHVLLVLLLLLVFFVLLQAHFNVVVQLFALLVRKFIEIEFQFLVFFFLVTIIVALALRLHNWNYSPQLLVFELVYFFNEIVAVLKVLGRRVLQVIKFAHSILTKGCLRLG